ncbi:ankyrin repeat domain-containing protein SOWAHA-like [Dunckerocampus dactyliophorus]|uniref:ankyrin repeat domain-containing protein SOWAHA-like n=1 Tax=Dunckerocampus dactyliophorus TaxID=161453 RepID=UPI0024061D9C|nr:ankyrin repeat domain-containing protein SOWAHA-like [Dunckerocampus dactyliophorus]
MLLSQESVLSVLLSAGGRVRKSELVSRFKDSVDCDDPAEKTRNRELFKTFVNNVACVKESEGVRYVVLKKTYQKCLQENTEDKEDKEEGPPEGEGEDKTTALLSPFELALHRSKYSETKVQKMLSFAAKPYALPLRMPSVDLKVDTPESPVRTKRRPPSDEPKDTRILSSVPLDQAEHEWLVKCASGHWSQVYGLLLRDRQLVHKRDFMSGFTALHWAAKHGNGDMLEKLVDLSRETGDAVDVNARTHGGYTPLHVAALHKQDNILAVLVAEYGADVSIRDNGGKRAYHYLHKDASETIREMLSQPKPQQAGDDREEPFQDLSKGRHSISRLFQPHVRPHRRGHKQRPAFFSLSDEPAGEEQEDGVFRHRIVSDAFA